MAHACKWPGCPEITPERGHCPRHAKRGEQLAGERDRRQRDPEVRKLYNSSAWRKLRRRLLDEDPVCRRCRREWATECHHVRKVKDRPDLALDADNAKPLCRSCHDLEEAEGDRGQARRRG